MTGPSGISWLLLYVQVSQICLYRRNVHESEGSNNSRLEGWINRTVRLVNNLFSVLLETEVTSVLPICYHIIRKFLAKCSRNRMSEFMVLEIFEHSCFKSSEMLERLLDAFGSSTYVRRDVAGKVLAL